MTAVAGEAGSDVINDHVGFFAPSSAYASNAGMENFSPNPDLAALRKEILAAGYNGEKVVFLGAADVPRITAICEVGADMLTKIGLNVDYVSLDWGTVVQRIFNKAPISGGRLEHLRLHVGRHGLGQSRQAMRRCGGTARTPGSAGPTTRNPKSIRDQWLHATDLPTQKALAADMQRQAFVDAPCMPLGLYYQPVAYRADLTGMMKGLILFTGVKRA